MFTVCKAEDDKYHLLIEYDLQFFAEDANGAEKSEEPTAKKLDDARKEGQVAKSQEIATAFSLLAFFLLLRFGYGFLGENFENIFSRVYNSIPNVARTYDRHLPISYISSILINALLTMMFIFVMQWVFVEYGGEVLSVEALSLDSWLNCFVLAVLVIPMKRLIQFGLVKYKASKA